MTLSPEMRQILIERLAAADGSDAAPIYVATGPGLRCATVEDGERLAARLEAWLDIFAELREASTTAEDREGFGRLIEAWSDVGADLEAAIHATREQGVPWEEARELTAEPRGDTIAARRITGAGTIDPRIVVVTSTEAETSMTKKYDPHPMQPVVKDARGVLRFRDNAIVRTLVDDLGSFIAPEGARRGKLDLVKIEALDVTTDDRVQFEQLAGIRPGARQNAIVHHVVEHAAEIVATHPMHAGRVDLNRLSIMEFPQEDREQFAQLMGYSISGYHELSYVSDESAAAASRLADHVSPGAGGCRDAGCPIHGGPLVDEDEEDLA